MKLTKSKLKQLIKEALEDIQEGKKSWSDRDAYIAKMKAKRSKDPSIRRMADLTRSMSKSFPKPRGMPKPLMGDPAGVGGGLRGLAKDAAAALAQKELEASDLNERQYYPLPPIPRGMAFPNEDGYNSFPDEDGFPVYEGEVYSMPKYKEFFDWLKSHKPLGPYELEPEPEESYFDPDPEPSPSYAVPMNESLNDINESLFSGIFSGERLAGGDEEAASGIRRETNLALATEREVISMLKEMIEMYRMLPYKIQKPNTRVYRAIKSAHVHMQFARAKELDKKARLERT